MTVPPAPQPPVPPSQPPGPRSNTGLLILLGIVGGILILSCLCCGGAYLGARFLFQRKLSTATATMSAPLVTPPAAAPAGIPPGFPADIPLYPGATVAAEGWSRPNVGGAFWHTADKPADVAGFYQKKLTDAGWSEISTKADGTTLTSIYQKGNRSVAVHVTQTDGPAMIMINYDNTDPNPSK